MVNDNSLNDLWAKALSSLEKDLNKPIFETISSSTRPLAIEDGALLLAVPNGFSQDWLYEKKCDASILSALKKTGAAERIRSIRFIIVPKEDASEEEDPRDKGIASQPDQRISVPFLNRRYTFDNFVVGHANRFAHAAALAVAESLGKAYNPLFVYGGVGLGKTHLMQAIGWHVIKTNPKAKIAYLTSEKFTNEVIDSIRYDKMTSFRNKYRSVDLFMVDDVQFIAGKERTQEEFFFTFNSLYEAGKQLIISNDRPPKEISDIEERLRSRFEWGLIADIQPPDFETRIAILKKKAELDEMTISDEVYNMIASRITTNIRELEGALVRLVAHSAMDSREVTKEIAEEVLKDIISPSRNKPVITIDLIKKTAAEFYSLKIDDMNAKKRTKEIATARQVAMFLCRDMTNASLPKIGSSFGGRDHTTVIHAYDKIKACIEELRDKEVIDAVNSIVSRIKKSCM